MEGRAWGARTGTAGWGGVTDGSPLPSGTNETQRPGKTKAQEKKTCRSPWAFPPAAWCRWCQSRLKSGGCKALRPREVSDATGLSALLLCSVPPASDDLLPLRPRAGLLRACVPGPGPPRAAAGRQSALPSDLRRAQEQRRQLSPVPRQAGGCPGRPAGASSPDREKSDRSGYPGTLRFPDTADEEATIGRQGPAEGALSVLRHRLPGR